MVGHQNVSCPYNLRKRTLRQVLGKSSISKSVRRISSMSSDTIHHRQGPSYPSRGINELPNEVLVILLRNLSSNAFLNARAVCKRWRSLTDYIVRTTESPLRNRRIVLQTTYEYNWHIDAVKEFSSNLGTPFPSASIKIFGHPSILPVEGPYSPFDTRLRPIQQKFFSVCGQYIQHLNLVELEMSQHELATITSSTPFLKSICLGFRWMYDDSMNHNCINCLDPVKMTYLQTLELNVHHNSAIWKEDSDLEISKDLTQVKTSYLSCVEFLAHFLRKCGGKQVKHLSLNGCDLFQVAMLVLEANRKIRGNQDNANVSHLSPAGISCILDLFNAGIRFPNLNSLSLQIGKELITTICNLKFPLRELSLTLSGPNLGGEHLREIMKFGKTLRHLTLDFTNCDQRNFEKDEFRNFRMELPILESLKLVYYSGILDFIISFAKTLTSLEINAPNEKLRYLLLTRKSKLYEKLPKLRRISLLL